MNTKKRFALVFLSATTLLLMVFAPAAVPVRAQEGKWEEFVLPEGYFPTAIQFFDVRAGFVYGKRYIGDGDFVPFIFATTDGGATWDIQESRLEMLGRWTSHFAVDLPQTGETIRDCEVSGVEELFVVSPEEMYANALTSCTLRTGGLENVFEGLNIFHTNDGGKSWARIFFKDAGGNLMVVDGGARSFALSPDVGTWLILYNNETDKKQSFFSSDGETFTPSSIADLPDNSVYELEFPGDSFGYVLAYFEPGNRILVTLDGGETWSEIPLPPGSESHAWLHAHFLDEKTGWLAGSSTVTWDEPMQALVFPEAIYKTADGGVTWEEVLVLGLDEDGQNVFLNLRDIQFQNPSIGFAFGEYDVFGNDLEDTAPPENILLLTTDGGMMWEMILRAKYFGCVETTESFVFVCKEGSILRMTLPSPRPTPTPILTSTKTPIPSATSMPGPLPGLDGLPCASAPAIILLFSLPIWLLLAKR